MAVKETLWGGIGGAVLGAVLTALVGGFNYSEMRKQSKLLERQAAAAENSAATANADLSRCDQDLSRYLQQLKEAPAKFHSDIARIVKKSSDPNRNLDQMVSDARAIVGARDSYLEVLESIQKQLNGLIDALAREVAKEPPDERKLRESLQALSEYWPTKEAPLELAASKLLLRHGVSVLPPKQSPRLQAPSNMRPLQ